MKFLTHWVTRLEHRWLAPAYSGWLVIAIAACFFGAATNTLSGWLYVLSGVMLAILVINGVLAVKTLKGLDVQRSPIEPVSVGELLYLELTLHNRSNRPKALVQVSDQLPFVMGSPLKTVVPIISAQGQWQWQSEVTVNRRGIYQWQQITLRTAAPLGLLWCSRPRQAQARAVVYPQILPLSQCPLLDEMGVTQKPLFVSRDRNSQAATEGMTRSLRPYRWGDSTRLIHWRTSARYGNLQIRELEVFTGGPEVVIALDSSGTWPEDAFEQAVSAAASLYLYAQRQGYTVSLWTASTGLQQGYHPVLETLAGIDIGDGGTAKLPQQPCLWLSHRHPKAMTLPVNSRWIIWRDPQRITELAPDPGSAGVMIDPDQPLLNQLQLG